MQTFLPYVCPVQSAQALHRQHLGKQRVEAVQILQVLLGFRDGWRHHPAVKMWRGHEAYLLKVYLTAMMGEWEEVRGYNNTKCAEHYQKMAPLVNDDLRPPVWLTKEFCHRHQSNLVRKKPEYYGPRFPGVPDDLPYIWPV